MYLIKLSPAQMEELYYLREWRKKQGQKSTIIGMIREIVGNYLDENSDEIKKGYFLVKEKENKQNKLKKVIF
uniref:Uncharacterized protein n=1 Tax=Dictyoglomus turgidum TaxID=513050 RepID=A0A7C3SM81_9BACT